MYKITNLQNALVTDCWSGSYCQQNVGESDKRLKEERLTILLTEQNALFAMDISDRAYVIDKGSIVYKGNVKELSEDRDTMKEYLGV